MKAMAVLLSFTLRREKDGGSFFFKGLWQVSPFPPPEEEEYFIYLFIYLYFA